MAPVRRQQKVLGAAALLLGSVFLAPSQLSSSSFATLGGSSRLSGRTARVSVAGSKTLHVPHVALPEFNPLPWADDLEGKEALGHAEVVSAMDKTVDYLEEFDQKLVDGLSVEELHEYDRALTQLIAEMEDKIAHQHNEVLRNAMEVQSESQVMWLESTMQSIGDLRRQLRRVRDREGRLQSSLADKDRGFLQTLMRAAAIGFGGHNAVPQRGYPASGPSSYTGQPAEAY